MNSYSIVLILIHGNLLEQSGQRPGGNHFPVPPQIQSANGKRWLKSHWSLHNGLHIRPKFQSSQAFAPFFGGGKSGHSLAKQSINGNQSTCKPFKKAENYDMYSCVYNQRHKRWFLACIHSFIHSFYFPLIIPFHFFLSFFFSLLFYSILFYSTLLYSIPFHSIHSIVFYLILF